jgi:hypothetical protein
MSIIRNYVENIPMNDQEMLMIMLEALPDIFEDVSMYESLLYDYIGYVKNEMPDKTAWVSEHDTSMQYFYLWKIMKAFNHEHIIVRGMFIQYFSLPLTMRKEYSLKYISENAEQIEKYIKENTEFFKQKPVKC